MTESPPPPPTLLHIIESDEVEDSANHSPRLFWGIVLNKM